MKNGNISYVRRIIFILKICFSFIKVVFNTRTTKSVEAPGFKFSLKNFTYQNNFHDFYSNTKKLNLSIGPFPHRFQSSGRNKYTLIVSSSSVKRKLAVNVWRSITFVDYEGMVLSKAHSIYRTNSMAFVDSAC